MAKFYKTLGNAQKRARERGGHVVAHRNGWRVVGRAGKHNAQYEHKKRMRKNWGQRRHW